MLRVAVLAAVVVAMASRIATASPGSAGMRSTPEGSATSVEDMPAVQYGALTQDACEAELNTRGISFQREEAKGVLAPVRLTGPLHGVDFHTNLREDRRADTHRIVAREVHVFRDPAQRPAAAA